MIKGMTAFARLEHVDSWGRLICEVRSVNHRFLDVSFRLSDLLQAFEYDFRKKITSSLNRGRVECVMRFIPEKKAGSTFEVNADLVKAIKIANETISEACGEKLALSSPMMMNWPDVIKSETPDVNQIKKASLALLAMTLKEVNQHRQSEGEVLSECIRTRLDAIAQQVKIVEATLPEIQKAHQTRLLKRFEEARVELEPERLAQEMLMMAQKMDVAEEIDRLKMQANEVKSVLSQSGPVGRRLDFLMQELNREGNTLSSKSIATETTLAAVEIKVLIEQMREQVQNIE